MSSTLQDEQITLSIPNYTIAFTDKDDKELLVVDILDAFTVAKAVDTESAEERKLRAAARAWDFNHDGVIDRRDADAVAISVVRLTPRPAGGKG